MTRDKYAKIIHNELGKLSVEFKRYKERWDKLSKSIETVNRDILSIHTTTSKITKRLIYLGYFAANEIYKIKKNTSFILLFEVEYLHFILVFVRIKVYLIYLGYFI